MANVNNFITASGNYHFKSKWKWQELTWLLTLSYRAISVLKTWAPPRATCTRYIAWGGGYGGVTAVRSIWRSCAYERRAAAAVSKDPHENIAHITLTKYIMKNECVCVILPLTSMQEHSRLDPPKCKELPFCSRAHAFRKIAWFPYQTPEKLQPIKKKVCFSSLAKKTLLNPYWC